MVTPRLIPQPEEQEYAFGMFRLLPQRHLLMRGDQPLPISSRAMDILALLAERRGELVSHQDIIARAWPQTVVEMNNLKVHVAAIRSALGDGKDGARYIATIRGRGYQFVAPVAVRNGRLMRDDPAPKPPCRKLPALRNRVLGRDDAMHAVRSMLGREGFVSLIGPGGVGKTAMAIAIAHRASQENMADVYFVDLSTVLDDTLVAATVAAALGMPPASGDLLAALLARLREHKHLLVLDNCEQVVNAVARLTEHIRTTAPGTQLLVTSREPLLSGGERVFRLAPLTHPPPNARLSARQALNYPAIQLFAERAKERLGAYVLRDADTPAVMEICQRLEGLPLAIELAAVRTEAFSVRTIAEALRLGHEHLAWARRCTASRHTTLAAAFDWSYDLLSAEAQQLLCLLAGFAHGFTLAAAQALCGGDHGLVAEGIADLVAKSFICASADAGGVRYQLFRHYRSCALRKLVSSPHAA